MPITVNAQSPKQQPQAREYRSRIPKPQPHLRFPNAIVLFRKTDHQPIAQTAGAKDLGEDGAEDEAEEEEALDLNTVICIRSWFHCEERAKPGEEWVSWWLG
jgi:hypothetical protein